MITKTSYEKFTYKHVGRNKRWVVTDYKLFGFILLYRVRVQMVTR